MPWKESGVVDERMRFVLRHKDGERMTDLCREFGISRKTAYKIWDRFKDIGPEGLVDQSRRPLRCPTRTSPELEALVVALRRKRPTWGPRKLRDEWQLLHPDVRCPSASTLALILERHGLSKRRRVRQSTPLYPHELCTSSAPNEVWCADFKGQFRLGNGKWCYPLTITDHFSRHINGCEALDGTETGPVIEAFEMVFSEYGLPLVIRTDNGSPFSSRGLAGLSRLAVWWIKLGILPERIEPGHPEQNGRHERMHRTLKQETTRPPAHNQLQQQERFNAFVLVFDRERPHEGIGMKRPAELYRPSLRRLPAVAPELRYPLHDETVRVDLGGHVRLGRQRRDAFITTVLAGELVGLRELEDGTWLVSFGPLDLGVVDRKTSRFIACETIRMPEPGSWSATGPTILPDPLMGPSSVTSSPPGGPDSSSDDEVDT